MKRQLTRLAAPLLALALCLPLGAPAAAYTDVDPEESYAYAADWCLARGLMIGEEDDQFKPDKPVDRGTAVTFLHRLAGEPAAAHDPAFSDVAEGEWYDAAVSWAVSAGVAVGYEDGTFRPEDTVTREELAAFLWRSVGSPSGSAYLADSDQVSDWAAGAVGWAAGRGIFPVTDSTFAPQGLVARAEAAVVLWRYYQRSTLRDDLLEAGCAPVGLCQGTDGALLVTDSYHRSILSVKDGVTTVWAGGSTPEDSTGRPVAGRGDGDRLKSSFALPWAIVPFLDGWAVSDAENGTVRYLTEDGVSTLKLKRSGKTLSLEYPTGLAVDGDGSLYIADSYPGIVYKVTKSGAVSVFAKDLKCPTGLCWSDGYLYVAETDADRIVKLGADKKVVTVAGGASRDYADGPAKKALFAFPQGVTVGEDGTVYVSDTGNSAVRAIRDGVVSTLLILDPATDDVIPMEPVGLLLSGDTLYICEGFVRKLLSLQVGR